MSKFHEEKRTRQAEIAYKYTNAQIQKIQDEAMMRGCSESFNILLGLMCLFLKNSCMWDEEDIVLACQRVMTMFERMNTPGGLTLEQVVEAAYRLGDVKSVLLKVGR